MRKLIFTICILLIGMIGYAQTSIFETGELVADSILLENSALISNAETDTLKLIETFVKVEGSFGVTGTLVGPASSSVALADSTGADEAGTYITGSDNIASLLLKMNVADSTTDAAGHYASYSDHAVTTAAVAVRVAYVDSTGADEAGTYVTGSDNIAALALKVAYADSTGTDVEGSYVSGHDNIANLALKVNLADSTTNAAGHYASYSDHVVTSAAVAVRVDYADSTGADAAGTYVTGSDNIASLALKADVADTKLQADIIELFSVVIGTDITNDSTAFNAAYNYGGEYNSADTLYVTQLTCVVKAGSEPSGSTTISVDLNWDTSYDDGSPVQLNASPLEVTSTTTGTIDTSFDNAVIDPACFVWWEVAVTEGRFPDQLMCTASGYVAD